MPHCRIPITHKGNHWFTQEEDAWVLSQLDSYLELAAKNERKDSFYTSLCETFYSEFPYRDPSRNPQWTFSPQQQKLAMGSKDKSKLRRRLGDKLGYAKRRLEKRPGGASAMSVCSTRSLVGDTEDERWRSGDISMHAGSSRHGSTAPEDTQADDHTSASYLAPNPNALEPAYYGSKQDEEELNDLVRELIDMGDASWAHLGEKKLRQRQARVPSLLHTLLKIIGRATGVEINIDSVWHDGRGMKACSASTERISAFTHSEDARKARSNFIRFVCESLGPRVCTAVADAHPTVYGDPKRQMRPVLPPRSDNWVVERQILILFFEYLWLWQGGHLPVPWQRLELDGLSRKFFLIEQRRLPSGVDCLRNPDNWDQDETDAWATALRDPSTPSHSRFQFRQPRPGMVEHETRTTIHPDSHLVYQPESLLYVRRMAMEKASYERKWQGLPPIPTEPYKPLTERQLAEAKAAVAGYKPLADLLNYLADYETYGPHQVSTLGISSLKLNHVCLGHKRRLGKGGERLWPYQLQTSEPDGRNGASCAWCTRKLRTSTRTRILRFHRRDVQPVEAGYLPRFGRQ
ncbi:hypothetical protein FRC08_017378 [Ceratobasidium sp. 394]|nr:hypothetical protein FRC08_017378 [Ceratobasidium sp. 394]